MWRERGMNVYLPVIERAHQIGYDRLGSEHMAGSDSEQLQWEK